MYRLAGKQPALRIVKSGTKFAASSAVGSTSMFRMKSAWYARDVTTRIAIRCSASHPAYASTTKRRSRVLR